MRFWLSFSAILLVATVTLPGCSRHEPTESPEPSDSTNISADSPLNSNPETDNTLPLVPTSAAEFEQDDKILSPQSDGWDSEFDAEVAGKTLKAIWHGIQTRSTVSEFLNSQMIVQDVETGPSETRYQDGAISVQRVQLSHKSHSITADDFTDQIRSTIPFSDLSHLHYHVKITSVRYEANKVRTTALLELANSDAMQSWQSNATWECQWIRVDATHLKLAAIQVARRQDAVIQTRQAWFADKTMALVGEDASYLRQLEHGHHYWLQRIERSHRFDTSVRNGLAVGDANGDGLDDVYLCQPPGLPNLLFIHQPDGSVKNVAAEAGVDWLDQTSAAIFADLDNDGDQDLVVGTPTGTLILANDGQLHFQHQATLSHEYDVQSISVVDYDADGWLDVFICIYRTESPSADQHFLYRDAVGGGQNRLYRNTSQNQPRTFQDVSHESKIAETAARYTLAASWEDFDNDGDQDLYVANDFGKNYFYRNDDGTFTDVAAEAGVEDIGSGMSVGWGDFDNDGLMDLYVGNMFSSAGSRVTSQTAFRSNEKDEIRDIYKRLAKGNTLFKNQGDGTFREVGEAANVELGRWAWSSLFADLNNDGWQDLMVANGYITTSDTGDL
ncbi:MAG: VCBS repeat-containing protein [Planctomycetales bacterium]|nr:VCBS repeat-containing protein [Planctomycetales bacterium]